MGKRAEGNGCSQMKISTWYVSALGLGLLMVHVSFHLFANAQSQGHSTNSYPGSTGADFWVLSGQSNMVGWGLLKAPVDTDPRIVQLNQENQWVPAEMPLHQLFFSKEGPVDQNILLQRGDLVLPAGMTPESFLDEAKTQKKVLGGVGPGLFFAEHLVKYTNRSIGLIPCAAGGTSIQLWDPALKAQGKKSLYGAMIEKISGRRQAEGRALVPG
jgi:hypothetical protein